MTVTAEFRSIDARLLVGGEWIESHDHREVVSPVHGQVVGSVPLGTAENVDRAVRAATDAAPGWAETTVFERAAALRRLVAAIEDRREDLALTLTLEQGKPLHAEAFAEIDDLTGYLEAAAEDAVRLEGLMPPSRDPGKRVFVYRVPRGVVGAIQPWNFPLDTIGCQIGPALACGNPVVSISSPLTSLSAYSFAQCVEAAELPPGVFNLVTGDGPVVGEALTGHPGIRAMLFTGSAATGQRIAERAAGKPIILELGGNGPFVVLDDADLDLAIPAALWSSFYNAGQACTAAERFLVQDAVYEEFAERLTAATEAEINLGDPLDEACVIGPLNNQQVAGKMDAHVADATARGATVLTGGSRDAGRPTDLYWQPTVLVGVTNDMLVSSEETFGPIAPMERISSDIEALAAIDRSSYGLSAAVFTTDLARGLRFAEKAAVGTIVVNDMSHGVELQLPFGGAAGKHSGIGRTNGRFPMEQVFTEMKTVIVQLGS